jgi:hypothetical protein
MVAQSAFRNEIVLYWIGGAIYDDDVTIVQAAS